MITGPTAPTARATVALLVDDPELAIGIPEGERDQAKRALTVPLLVADRGALDLEAARQEPTLGFVVLRGMVHVSVTLGGRAASQLAGPGDLLHGSLAQSTMLPAEISYEVAETLHLAVLDRRFIAGVRRWPGLLITLHERLRDQEHRLAVHAAIGKLRHVNVRVLAALWQIGEQWGRVTADGVAIPLALTHETIGKLAGAERPTVSLALTELTNQGAVMRRADGVFVLAPDSLSRLAQLGPTPRRAPSPPHRVPTADANRDALRQRLAALNETFPDRVRRHDERLAAARELSEQSRRTRDEVARRRAELMANDVIAALAELPVRAQR